MVKGKWAPKKEDADRSNDTSDQLPQIPFDIIGCQDNTSALLAISFLGSILSSAQVDDPESQILFSIMKEASQAFPEVVSLA